MNHPVSIEDSHKAYVVKVKSFSYHLRPDQNIGLATFELIDDRFVPSL